MDGTSTRNTLFPFVFLILCMQQFSLHNKWEKWQKMAKTLKNDKKLTKMIKMRINDGDY